ncbi:MAG: amidohydrolase [Planctomycetota bacterium]|nr:amidohydrolase [Planctomycetota bacterium]
MTVIDLPELDRTIVDRAIEIRRDLHAHPEIAYEEHRTAGVIAAELERLGIAHRTGLAGGTGVLAWIEGRDSDDVVALRTDIDALPIEEETGLPWASTIPGRMHACGHDGHTAIMLGTAARLADLAERGQLPRSVAMVFQPAEEGGAGGRRMVEDGVLDGSIAPWPVARIYGLHGWPLDPAGTTGTILGPMLAASDKFEIEVSGEGCHAAWPHSGRDPIAAAAAIVTALHAIVSRNVDPLDAAVVRVTKISAGSTFNVIPPNASLAGTARSLSNEVRDLLERRIAEVAEGVATAHGCTATATYHRGYPVTVNHPDPTARFERLAREELGDEAYRPMPGPVMGGEDFSFYGEKVPACFYVLGQQAEGGEPMPALHSPRYDFNDETISTGIRLMSRVAVDG